MLAPAFDDDPRLGEVVEDLVVQELVPELRIEALAVAIFPRATRFDERGFRSHCRDPLPHGLGDELRAVVRSNMARHAPQDEQIRQDVDDVGRIELAIDGSPSIPG